MFIEQMNSFACGSLLAFGEIWGHRSCITKESALSSQESNQDVFRTRRFHVSISSMVECFSGNYTSRQCQDSKGKIVLRLQRLF